MQVKMMLMVLLCTSVPIQVKAQANDSVIAPVFEPFNSSGAIANSRDILCVSYEPSGICKKFFSTYCNHPVTFAVNTSHYGDISTYQDAFTIFYNFLLSDALSASKRCLDALIPFLCRRIFSTCDPAFNQSVEQRICRRACETLTVFVCPEVTTVVLEQSSNLNFMMLGAPRCDGLMNANGGDAPDCIDSLDGGEIPQFSITTDCFTGLGRGYNGTMNITRSGRTCQCWSEQAPHQFILSSKQYPEIAGGHNYCRNPGSRAPKGPWCFTTDPNTRWEYCNVPKCDPPSCELYHNTPGAVCFGYGSIGYDYVFQNSTKDLNDLLGRFYAALKNSHKDHFPLECIDMIFGLLCHHSFPLCDHSSDTPVPRKICRSYCEEVSRGKCKDLWDKMKSTDSLQIITLPDCHTLPSPEGGDYLECFIPYNNGRARRDINSTDCYTEENLGIYYNGTLNVTGSGKCCQKWDSDTPHSHPLISLHRPYLEGHNYCRNPEGRGKRPWCYTTDPHVRWEYCNVSLCVVEKAVGTSSERTNSVIIAVAVTIPFLLVILVILIAIIFVLCVVKRREQAGFLYTLSKSPNDNNNNEETVCNDNYVPISTVMGIEQLPNIPRENIICMCELGQGNFGTVMKGEAKDVAPDQSSTLVAIKYLREGSDSDARNDFMREAVVVNQFDHPNILKLLGVCFDQEPYFITFEYMELGDLNKYLRNKAISISQASSNLTVQQLVDMAIDIAAGLEYLAEHHFVHRDLATRNCLINEQLFVKIADFGLSKDVYSTDYYRLGERSLLPIRWMPPEAILYCRFSTQSDIWSFGIVFWEIFAGGVQPYYTLSNDEVVEYVTNKNVLLCPSGCPRSLYKLMVDCWAVTPDSRPTASEIYTRLRDWSPELSADDTQSTAQTEPKSTSLHRNGSLIHNKETIV